MKFAVCAIAKLENSYIREWVEHHLSIGFDKIILYDNNDLDGENLADPIQDYVNEKKVDIINARGKKDYQVEAYDACYHNYADLVDWILFIDIDEFLDFDPENKFNIKTIQDFVNYNEAYKNCDAIMFPWYPYTDSDLITVKDNNYSVLTRFKERKLAPGTSDINFKEMVRTKIDGLRITGVHRIWLFPSGSETNACFRNSAELFYSLRFKDVNGEIFDYEKSSPDYNKLQLAFIKHFRYKTIQEFLEAKWARGYPMPWLKQGKLLGLHKFFSLNNITEEKLLFVKNWLDQNKDKLSTERKELLERDLRYFIKISYVDIDF